MLQNFQVGFVFFFNVSVDINLESIKKKVKTWWTQVVRIIQNVVVNKYIDLLILQLLIYMSYSQCGHSYLVMYSSKHFTYTVVLCDWFSYHPHFTEEAIETQKILIFPRSYSQQTVELGFKPQHKQSQKFITYLSNKCGTITWS